MVYFNDSFQLHGGGSGVECEASRPDMRQTHRHWRSSTYVMGVDARSSTRDGLPA